MLETPKISIIIAIYNVENYLHQCLDSLVNQSLKDIEIICVNDGSTDNSLEILNEYAGKDNRFVIINQENKGPGVARNNGIKVATGDYIMIVDPDDWLELFACEFAYNKITKNQCDIVFFDFQKLIEETNETIVDNTRLKPLKDAIFNTEKINLSELLNNFITAVFSWNKIYSRKLIMDNNIRYSETYLCEDAVFTIGAISNANSVSILDMPIYNYRIRKTSQSSSFKKHWEEILTNHQQILKYIKTSDNEMNYIYPVLIYLINSEFYWYKQTAQKFPRLQKKYYNKMRKLFLEINEQYEIEKIKEYINYKKFTKICVKNWNNIMFEIISQNIFQITNIGPYKILTIFGIKIKLKKRIKQMKRVITYGTYDVLHYGHINLLKRAKALGDYLIVVLSTDEFNAIKNKKSYYSYEQRKKILESLRYVDLVIPEYNWEQKISDIQKYQADIFVMGDDWEGKFDFLKDYCEVVYLPRTPNVCSTKTKEYLNMK